MSGCGRFGADLEAYLDSELPAAEAERLEAHLPGCDACRRALDDQRWLGDRLAALPEIEPSEHFEARFRARLARSRTRSGWRGWLRTPALAWGLGVALLAMALFLGWPRPAPLGEADWAAVAEPEEFEIAVSADPRLLEVLDVLEAWDDS